MFSVISRILVGWRGDLPHCKGSVGVFYNPTSRLGNRHLWVELPNIILNELFENYFSCMLLIIILFIYSKIFGLNIWNEEVWLKNIIDAYIHSESSLLKLAVHLKVKYSKPLNFGHRVLLCLIVSIKSFFKRIHIFSIDNEIIIDKKSHYHINKRKNFFSKNMKASTNYHAATWSNNHHDLFKYRILHRDLKLFLCYLLFLVLYVTHDPSFLDVEVTVALWLTSWPVTS